MSAWSLVRMTASGLFSFPPTHPAAPFSMDVDHTYEYLTIAGYLLLILGVGFAFGRLNRNAGDYFRSGSRGVWWLVGSSLFMTTFSAWTFTGAAGVAYLVGWSVLCGFAGNVVAYLLNVAWYARWFRQLRVTTAPEAIALRFGPTTRQFYAWVSACTAVPIAALQLYGLAIFCSSVFGIEIGVTIVGAGTVVVLYSIFGGSWSVMATDFIQSLILVPITIAIAVLCLMEVGGIQGLLRQIELFELGERFELFKPAGAFPNNAYTWAWGLSLFLRNMMQELSLNSSQRFFTVKDGREAARAALLCCGLLACGLFLWFIPPITARLLFAEDVQAIGRHLAKPAEAAYIVAGMRLLPVGFSGILVTAMFAATMSSMDSGLNRIAAILVRDIAPAFCRRLGRAEPDEMRQLAWGRWATAGLGALIITCAVRYSSIKGTGIFEMMTQTSALLAIPMAMPMILAVVIRRVPSWAAVFAVCCGFASSLCSYNSETLFGHAWNLQTTIFSNMLSGATGFFLTMPFWRTAPPAYREQVNAFFERMNTPVNFELEVGDANDPTQLRILGWSTIVVGTAFLALLLLPNALSGKIVIVASAGFLVAVGSFMVWSARRTTASDKSSRRDA